MTRAAYLLAGPTASGKSAAAAILARKLGAAILNADSMIVYRGMDIGTAKPSCAEQIEFQMGGVDLVAPDEEFSAGAWLNAAHKYIATLDAARPLIVVGGTGLYFTALLRGLDRPKLDEVALAQANDLIATHGLAAAFNHLQTLDAHTAATLTDAQNPRRLAAAIARVTQGTVATQRTTPLPSYPVLRLAREVLRERIAKRLDAMLTGGWPKEVASLNAMYPTLSRTAAAAIGYSLPQQRDEIFVRTCRLAKRQDTWFRHQANALYIDVIAEDNAEEVATKVYSVWQAHGPWEIKL